LALFHLDNYTLELLDPGRLGDFDQESSIPQNRLRDGDRPSGPWQRHAPADTV